MSWTRRDFLTTAGAGLLVASLRPSYALAGFAGRELTELRRNVGIFTSRGGTIGWLASRDGALVVDSQFPDSARACLNALREVHAPPLAALINSHHHADHTAGNGVFREASRTIVAQRRVPELQRRAAEAGGSEEEQVYADTLFARELSLEVGDERVRATHYGPAHTGGDCTIAFEAAEVVHMGDLVFNRLYPFIDRAGGASVRGWIELLETVVGEHPAGTIYVHGHGRPEFGVTGGGEDLLLQRDLLSAVLETAARAIAAGASREEATAVERLDAFPDHVAPSPRLSPGFAIGAAYDELTEDD